MEPRVKRIYDMMLSRLYVASKKSLARTAKHELETLIELKEAEVKWIRKGSK